MTCRHDIALSFWGIKGSKVIQQKSRALLLSFLKTNYFVTRRFIPWWVALQHCSLPFPLQCNYSEFSNIFKNHFIKNIFRRNLHPTIPINNRYISRFDCFSITLCPSQWIIKPILSIIQIKMGTHWYFCPASTNFRNGFRFEVCHTIQTFLSVDVYLSFGIPARHSISTKRQLHKDLARTGDELFMVARMSPQPILQFSPVRFVTYMDLFILFVPLYYFDVGSVVNTFLKLWNDNKCWTMQFE